MAFTSSCQVNVPSNCTPLLSWLPWSSNALYELVLRGSTPLFVTVPFLFLWLWHCGVHAPATWCWRWESLPRRLAHRARSRALGNLLVNISCGILAFALGCAFLLFISQSIAVRQSFQAITNAPWFRTCHSVREAFGMRQDHIHRPTRCCVCLVAPVLFSSRGSTLNQSSEIFFLKNSWTQPLVPGHQRLIPLVVSMLSLFLVPCDCMECSHLSTRCSGYVWPHCL